MRSSLLLGDHLRGIFLLPAKTRQQPVADTKFQLAIWLVTLGSGASDGGHGGGSGYAAQIDLRPRSHFECAICSSHRALRVLRVVHIGITQG